MRVPTIPAHIFFLLCKEIPASHRAQRGTPTLHILLGADCEGKERVKGKASQIHSSRTGSALVCVRRNVQHREINLPKLTRFTPIAVVIVAVPTNGPNGCPVSPPPLSSQSIQSHEKSPTSHRSRGETQASSLTLGAKRESKERVNGKASRIQSSRIGSALICVRRKANLELKLHDSTRFLLFIVVLVAVFPNGPIGCLVIPPPLSSQNIQSREKSSTSHRARGKTQAMSLALSVNRKGKERVKGEASRIQPVVE